MSTCRAIDRAALARGTLADQMGSSVIDRGARARAQARIARVAALLPSHDRELLRIVSTPDETGELPGPSTIGRRLGITRQSAARRRSRLYRRIRRATLPPAPTPAAAFALPPVEQLAAHLCACAGATPTGARRLARLLHGETVAAVAAAERAARRRVFRSAAITAARIGGACPVCASVVLARAARGGIPLDDGRARA